jgi:DNA-binding HxlR family transcriptional regulator
MGADTNKLIELHKAVGHVDVGRLDGLQNILASMNGVSPGQDDPVREIPARLGDRWSTLLLMVLQTGTYRHAELKRVVSILASEAGISQRMLTLRLRALERDGLVRRSVSGDTPPKVDYALTKFGQELIVRFVEIIRWIEANDSVIQTARKEFQPF